jgi:hypothetical protein
MRPVQKLISGTPARRLRARASGYGPGTLMAGAVVALLGFLFAVNLPSIRRYIRIEMM